ncbi:hypothetical protein P7C70_g1293, partial [Phenoliferia sp. Uapishka_3]
MSRLAQVTLLPLQIAALILLHFSFALYRLYRVLLHLPSNLRTSLSPRTPLQDTSSDLSRDKHNKRWSKSPKNLAVIFVPSKIRWSARKRGTETAEVEKLVQDLRLLLKWAEQLELESLAIYDEKGILDRNSEAVLATLSASFPLLSSRPSGNQLLGSTTFRLPRQRVDHLKEELLEALVGREVDSGCGSSEEACEREESVTFSASASTLVAPTIASGFNSSNPLFLTVNILSRLSGRPHLARIAQRLSESMGKKGLMNLPEGAVEEEIEEPDLLLVLGGPYLRLHGFPPWQVRLTEMYHHPSPSWLPPPHLNYSIFRRALDLYGLAEMRVGR